MGKSKLSGRVGAAQDACAVLQTNMDLTDSEERGIVFRLGAGRDRYSAVQTAKKCRGLLAAENALVRVKEFWKKTLSAVQVQTPDPSINFLFNGWLDYQDFIFLNMGKKRILSIRRSIRFP